MFLDEPVLIKPPLATALKLLLLSLVDIFRPIQTISAEEIVIKKNELKIWALGHASTLINFYGKTILTDPVLVKWLPFPKRLVESPFKIENLPEIDYLIISHAHFDHCNKKSLKKLASKTHTIIMPKNCFDILRGMGYKNVIEINWGETHRGDVEVTAFKPRHWGMRYPWEKIKRGYNCYVLERNNQAVFFAGDTGYSALFKTIGEIYKIKYAILPIGAYNNPPTFRPSHMDPEDAIKAFEDLGADHLIPIHWGNFRLALEPLDEPAEKLAGLAEQRGLSQRVHILKNGESFGDK